MGRLLFIFLVTLLLQAKAADRRGSEFSSFTRLDEFQREVNGSDLVLFSKFIRPEIDWNELVPSWNFRGERSQGLTFQARVVYPDQETKWYHLGHWSCDALDLSRGSVRGQKDADGTVSTDILKTERRGGALQLKITLHGCTNASGLNFVGLSFCDSTRHLEPLTSDKKAWGKSIRVPERSQVDYAEGVSSWCSPTSLSMILSFWSRQIQRPDLEHAVPEVAREVNDPNWPGTGNWPFNTAFAGAHQQMRACVTRFSDVTELEQWIDAGIPMALSVSYGTLQGKAERGNGHLVVCIGFTASGDVIVNDPGRGVVRQTYTRANLIKAWGESNDTVYLTYPENTAVPTDRFGHWPGELPKASN
ncbi:MAG TPA: peptidase C39 family protein [Verrucomicrobiae bacterium]|nr:peptidase C39 family protein [Verrucomicrobiae bacterium]